MTTTDYSGGFIYENNALQHFAHEEGRVRKSGANLVYDYYIKDHLGNTRMTLTEATDITEYRATMETGTSSSGTNMETYEENLFLNVEEVCSTQPGINTTDVPGFTDDKVAALNGSVAARRAGPAKLLAVTAGDQVSVTVDSYHTGNTSTGVQTKATMVSAIAGLFGSLSGGGVEQQAVYDLFNGVSTTGFLYSGSTSTSAKAYLNMLVFDQDFNFVGVGGFDRADQTSGYQTLSVSATINQGGYVYVYLSNESTANFEVYFDNLNITHTKGAILQEDHYYPFGLSIAALSSTAPLNKPNKFKLSGNEEQTEFDLNVYDFNARTYDPVLGRFMQIDIMADVEHSIGMTPYHYVANNPTRFIDPLGTDWYQEVDEDGNLVDGGAVFWREGSDEQDGYQNIGTSYTMDLGDGLSITFNQNQLESRTETVLEEDDWETQREPRYDENGRQIGSQNKEGDEGNCFYQCGVMVSNSGATSLGGTVNNITGTQNQIDYIRSQVTNGSSVRVHVDYNGDGVGDHWVSISSATTNLQNGSSTFNFYDPRTINQANGTSRDNTLSLNNGSISGTTAYRANSNVTYTIVAVRRNQ
ncbi:hypothetical protein OB69_03595 [Roseivirga seohaensis subsp. aquiponti]|uniref:RHS repeat-associated core domain-containing protein n=1 Tax=Roseivirga seohaensis subsp. aquiponti TaxID=1566026 RepID=A0A0L8API5_9BACT|nr:RHS repeat-associated core domain-containing protein [Roseivirga seohaensis]KOF04082.1 hypothetical protein OB69_03595 [Roseivirga seohaensis subsp. aquiponti]